MEKENGMIWRSKKWASFSACWVGDVNNSHQEMWGVSGCVRNRSGIEKGSLSPSISLSFANWPRWLRDVSRTPKWPWSLKPQSRNKGKNIKRHKKRTPKSQQHKECSKRRNKNYERRSEIELEQCWGHGKWKWGMKNVRERRGVRNRAKCDRRINTTEEGFWKDH